MGFAAMTSSKSGIASVHVLFVEDEFLISEWVAQALSEQGFCVQAVSTAAEALQALRRDPVDVLFTDINLPGNMDGLKLAASVKTRRPEMNIIIVTGYGTPQGDEIPPGSLFVPKPYNARKMIEAVRHFQ